VAQFAERADMAFRGRPHHRAPGNSSSLLAVSGRAIRSVAHDRESHAARLYDARHALELSGRPREQSKAIMTATRMVHQTMSTPSEPGSRSQKQEVK
jgi:hypothetical protein